MYRPSSRHTNSGIPQRRWRSVPGRRSRLYKRMLGHAKASMTLDLYGHLFEDELDTVADRLNAHHRAVTEAECGQGVGKTLRAAR